MRKLTKKALSLVLCVMLVVSAISCAFSVIAETVGTSTVPGKGWVVYDAPYDLNGTEGMSTWLGNDSTAGPYMISENGVLKSGEGNSLSAWHEVGPARFKIPGAVAGTKVKISFEFAVNTVGISAAAQEKLDVNERLQWLMFRQYSFVDGSTIAEQAKDVLPSDDGKTIVSQEFTLTGSDDFFRIIFRSAKTARDCWRISNVTVTVTHPEPAPGEGDEETPTIPSYYGTEEKGVKSGLTSYPRDLKPVDGVHNLDFENGFIYWSGSKSGDNYASDTFKLVTSEDGTNTYVTLKDTGYAGNIQTVLFKLSGVEVGDKLVLVYDVKGADAGKIVPYLLQDGVRPVEYDETTGLNISKNPTDSSKKWNATGGAPSTTVGSETANSVHSVQTAADGWTTMVTERNNRVKDPTTLTSSATSDIYVQVCIGRTKSSVVPDGTVLDVAIDNIRIAKVVDGVYYDVATGEEIKESEEEEEEEVTPTIPSYYGTEADGFHSNGSSWPMALKPVEGLQNLDFSNGFIYWSGKKYNSANDPGSLASASFKLVTEGDNKYFAVKDEGYVNTMRSALFKVEGVNVGDTLALVYDAKGADAEKIRVTLIQDHIRGSEYVTYSETTGLNTTGTNASPGVSNPLVNGAARLEATDLVAADGWTTYATGFTNAVNDPLLASTSKVCLPDIFLQIIVEKASGVNAGDKLDAAIDNIRVAKVVNNVYYDIITGEEIYTYVEKVAQVGDDKYPTIEEAIAAANGGTVVLLKDIALADSLVIEAGTNIVLDLNGKTISRNTDAATSTAAIVNNGTLTIKDSVGGGKITAYAANPDTAEIPYYASNTITNCGVLTIKGGTIENSTGDEARAAFPIDNNSTVRDAILNIEGGTIIGRGAIRQFANSTTKKNEVNITGGTISGTSYAIWMQNPGSGDPLAALNISGGTVAKILLSPSANFEPAITGGTISEVAIWAASGDANRDPSGFITGGTFNTAVDSAFCAEGYVPVDNGNGTFSVEEKDPVATVGGVNYYTLEEAIAAANGGTVVLLADIALEAPITIAKGTVVTIDLNGKTLSGVDTTEKSYALIYNSGTLTINDTVGTGKITASATINSGWNRYSSVLSNNPGGKLTVNGGTIEHLGGTDMAYAIDNLTNGKGTYAETIINGGTVKSPYAAIRQFLNGIEAQNILTINGGTIMSDNRAIFFQDPSKNANTGTLTITANAEIYGDIRLSVTEGSTEWPVEVSIAADALKGDSQVTNNYLPDGYVIENNNGTFGVAEKDPVATIDGVNYYDLQEAINAANGGTVVLITNVVLDAPLTIAKDTVVTIDLNGKKITYTSTTQAEAMISNKGTLTINDTVGGGEIYYDYVGAADPSYGKGNYTIDNAGTLTLNGGKINIATLRQHAKYPINNNSTTGDAIFVMNGGALYNYNTSAIRQFCNSTVYQNSVTINGGLVEGYSAIWVQNPGKNTVNGTLTITGGEIRTTAAAYVNGSATVGEVSSSIYFTIDGEGGAWSETSAVVITGGTFNENVYLVEEAPANLTVDETAPTYNGRVELPVPPVVEEYDLETELYWVKGFKPAGSEDTRYGFLMTIGIDSLDYKKDGCGFYLTVGDTTKKFIIVNGTVWESLSVDLPTETKVLAPVDFGEGNNYIMHYTVYFTEAQLEALGSMEVSVQGFVTTFEGEELVTRTFNCGTLA